jgi:hypothetical protein
MHVEVWDNVFPLHASNKLRFIVGFLVLSFFHPNNAVDSNVQCLHNDSMYACALRAANV